MNDELTKPEAQPAPSSKPEIIQQIAKTLRDRRTARSLTIEKVSQTIKIRLPYLKAIESGEWNELPGEVYVRGFIRRYAQSLGLDGDKLLAPYLGVADPINEKDVPAIPEKPGEFGKIQLIWGFIGVLFIIGFLKVIKQDKNAPVKVPAPSATKTTPSTATAAPLTASKPEEPRAPLVSHLLTVVSPYPLWLRVSANEKNFEGFIPQSSTWTWKGEGVFTIRLGHTKQVVLLFDGKAVPLIDDQKIVTLPAQ